MSESVVEPLRIELLGPLRVEAADGTEVTVPGARLRLLLAELALRAGRPVPTGVLEDLLWPGDGPGGPGALQSLVSRLRRTLGTRASIEAGPAGYVLRGVLVDVPEVEAAFAQGHAELRAGRPDRAEAVLDEALGRWRGPLVEIAGAPDAGRLEESRLEALADRAAARVALGRTDGLAAELEELLRTHPLRERLAELRVRVLTAEGRAAEALAAYEETRRVLAEEFGSDPSAGLREAHRAALAAGDGAPAVPRPASLRSLTSFVGREDDVARVDALLRTARCVTVVGPGGAGKTRLSSEVGAALVATGTSVPVVPLAPVAEGPDVLGAVAAVLGARDTGRDRRPVAVATVDADQRSRVVAALGGGRTVLVLDNCEHVLDDVAHLVEDLLRACPALVVLTTSREALGVEGEVLHPLGPLAGPAALQLFTERAAAVSPGFSLTEPGERAVVEEVVERLDGLPLALELAAARLRTMTPTDLRDRLSDRFRLLTGGRRTAVARHRTLRAVVDWSWDLLDPDEKVLLQRLSVFHAPVSVEAAAAVATDLGDEVTVADLLGSLVEKSLLQLRSGPLARYALLETIREYGADRLAATGEVEKVLQARTGWAEGVAAGAATGLRGADQLAWSRRLDAEADDLLAALRHLAATGSADRALRLTVPVALWWSALGRHAAVREWTTVARSAGPSGTPLDLVGESLDVVNGLMEGLGEWEAGRARMQALHRALGDPAVGGGDPLSVLLAVFLDRFSTEAEGVWFDVARDPRVQPFLAEPPADPWLTALVHLMCGAGAENDGDIDAMARHARRAAAGFASVGESWGRAGALRLLAQRSVVTGDLDAAERLYREAGDLIAPFGNADDEVQLRMRLVDVLQRRGRTEEAARELVRLEPAAGPASATTRTWLVLSQLAGLRAQGHLDVARDLVERQLADLADRAGSGVWGHERAGLLAAAAHVLVETGSAQARERLPGLLVEAVDLAAATHDMPVVAMVAVAVARWLLLEGDPEQAARVLGTAATLRGAEDPTEPEVVRVREGLPTTPPALAAACSRAYGEGRDQERDAALAGLRAVVRSGVHARRL
ncbi:BTAD domain-containing putative transcriptional regulator [Kineococcus sp. NPDC059986]|uniref:ATP-binding protein n=1 Tax=Kineococcus sp. NPDC059986 TaxID=3155538 RepID=UPI00344DE0A6